MHPFEIISSDAADSVIAVKCPSCGEVYMLKVSNAGLLRYRDGALVQVAFPNLTADDRELFISGLCSKCFPKAPEEPEDEDEDDEDEDAEDEEFDCDDADDCEDDDCDGCGGCDDEEE